MQILNTRTEIQILNELKSQDKQVAYMLSWQW